MGRKTEPTLEDLQARYEQAQAKALAIEQDRARLVGEIQAAREGDRRVSARPRSPEPHPKHLGASTLGRAARAMMEWTTSKGKTV